MHRLGTLGRWRESDAARLTRHVKAAQYRLCDARRLNIVQVSDVMQRQRAC
jgi:hypothetical protein